VKGGGDYIPETPGYGKSAMIGVNASKQKVGLGVPKTQEIWCLVCNERENIGVCAVLWGSKSTPIQAWIGP
jgi:hypothetical protein